MLRGNVNKLKIIGLVIYLALLQIHSSEGDKEKKNRRNESILKENRKNRANG